MNSVRFPGLKRRPAAGSDKIVVTDERIVLGVSAGGSHAPTVAQARFRSAKLGQASEFLCALSVKTTECSIAVRKEEARISCDCALLRALVSEPGL